MNQTEEELRAKWDQRHQDAEDPGHVARVLEENLYLLPARGKALDLACGRGANALALATAGLDVHAWDLSSVGIARLDVAALEQGLTVHAAVRDVIKNPPEPNTFDVILVSYFLDRNLVSAIVSALKPGGLLFYQTFSQLAVSDCGPTSADFRLAENELLHLFRELKVRVYREESTLGDTCNGWRDLAMLIAEKQQGS
ncbi:MAG: methyltransferase domain-containing protein [Gammaproteobacteria bacterium]|nr:methyltransferase domain-containing protein [Gammaproteobacteria bacterium]